MAAGLALVNEISIALYNPTSSITVHPKNYAYS